MKKLGIKEELELEIANIKIQKIEEGKEFKREDLIDLTNIGAIMKNYDIPAKGEYKDYLFKIDENYVVTVIDKIKREYLNGGIKFKGGTMIVTKLSQSEIFSSSAGQYTVAMRVKINRNEQSTVRYMGLYGYHNANQGITLQFNDTTTIMGGINYDGNYDKWTDIVETYNNGIQKFYFNGELVKAVNFDKIPYPTFVIGNSYPDSINPRYMKGSISSVKVWSKELTESEIATLNMREKYTTIQEESIKLESGLDSLEEIQRIGTIQGSNYEILNNTWK